MRFENKVVVITGGAQGIGLGCANVFFSEGAKVAILDRDLQSAKNVCDQYNSIRSNSAVAIQCDVTSSEQIKAAIEQVMAEFQRMDCLINNAGIHPPDTPIENTTIEDTLATMQVNFISTYAASQYAITHLKASKGTIINMSSMTAVLGQKNSAAYAASKGAQLSFTKALALELAPFGVRVNAVLPSNVDTPLMRRWAASLPDADAALDRIAKLQPLGRMASPEEIGRVCLFLASDDSSFVTGQGIEADGGAALDY